METRASHLTVFFFFLILAVVFTAPLSLAPHERAVNDGDPLHISWATAWDAHQMVRAPWDLFESNTFFPYRSSLAFSDHFLGLALVSAPVFYLTGNALLAQNVALIVTLALSAFGMYALVVYLTGRKDAAIVAGVVYVFHAYTFHELPRAQVLSTQWLPLMLLYLHRSFVEGGRRNAVLFAMFFLLQGLACTYYLLYVALVLSVWIPVYTLMVPGGRKRLAGLMVPLGVSGGVFILLAIPYLRMVREFDFARALEPGLDLLEYVRPPVGSLLAQLVTFDFPPSIAPQFVGVVALVLALVGVIARPGLDTRPLRIFFALSMVTAVLGVAFSLGPSVRVGGETWGAGPYLILYEEVPFFRALRNAERMGWLFRFGLAVAAGLGASAVFSRLSGHVLTLARVAIVVVLPYEHFSGGQPFETIPTGARAPEVYRWLATTGETEPVVELPLYPRGQLRRHSLYMLYSTLHWRPIVFGRTSFYPPLTGYLRWQMNDFPSADSIGLLEGLGVERVVVHPNVWPAPARARKLSELQGFSGRLVQEGRFDPLSGRMYEAYGLGDERVYRLSGAGTIPSTTSLCSPGDELDPSDWTLSSDATVAVEWAIDRDPETKWSTERQLPGMKLEVDLGREQTIAAIRLTLGYPHDNFPRDLTLKVRRDGAGQRFERIDHRDDLATRWELVDALLNHPADAAVTLRFDPVPARRLRFWIREGKSFDYTLPDWTLPELHVYRRCD